MAEPNWTREIITLHEVFEAYFLGTTDDLSRVGAVLADDFTMVGPNGDTSDRLETMRAISGGHGHTSNLAIRTVDHTLLFEDGETLAVEYIEEHVLSDRTNRRRATVIFSAAPDAPNGLQWRRVHETWIDRGLDSH